MRPRHTSMAACLENLMWLSLGRLQRQKATLLSMTREALESLNLKEGPIIEGNFFSGYCAVAAIQSAGLTGQLTLGQMGAGGTEGARFAAEGLPAELDILSDYHEPYLKERIAFYWKDWSFLREPPPLTGDYEFDRYITVRGDPLRGIALMDADLRRAVLSTVGQGAELKGGRLMMCVNDEMFSDAAEMRAWTGPLVDLMRLLVERGGRETLSCLMDNARSDPLSEVRMFNLLALNRSFPESQKALDLNREVLKQETSPACRVAAAAGLRDEGVRYLVKIAQESAEESVRAAALYHLGHTMPHREAERILLSHAHGANPLMFKAAIRGLEAGAGGILAMKELQSLADQTENRYTRQEIRAVIARIQARLEGAEAGQLSVVAAAEGDEGRLSRPGE